MAEPAGLALAEEPAGSVRPLVADCSEQGLAHVMTVQPDAENPAGECSGQAAAAAVDDNGRLQLCLVLQWELEKEQHHHTDIAGHQGQEEGTKISVDTVDDQLWEAVVVAVGQLWEAVVVAVGQLWQDGDTEQTVVVAGG